MSQAYALMFRYSESDLLASVLEPLTRQLLDEFQIRTPLVTSTELGPRGVKSELVLNLCREVGATTYLSGPQGRNYLDLPAFEEVGIGVVFHDFPADPPVLSAVDHLFTKASKPWPQPVLTSAHSSPPPKAAEARLQA